MSHHLVTVCMFCLLCAAHTCASHTDRNNGVHAYEPKLLIQQENFNIERRKLDSKARYQMKLQKIRQKRDVRSVNPDAYVEQLFRLYGDAGSMTMNLTGFNEMIRGLELHKLVEGGAQRTETKDYIYGQAAKEDVVNVSIYDYRSRDCSYHLNLI